MLCLATVIFLSLLSSLVNVAADPDVLVDLDPSNIADMEGLQKVNVTLELSIQNASVTSYDVTLKNVKEVPEFRFENVYVGPEATNVLLVNGSRIPDLAQDQVVYVLDVLDDSEPKFIIIVELRASSDVELDSTYEIQLSLSWNTEPSSGETKFSKACPVLKLRTKTPTITFIATKEAVQPPYSSQLALPPGGMVLLEPTAMIPIGKVTAMQMQVKQMI